MVAKRNVYFFCCIGGDLLICSAISKLLKMINPEINTILLMPAHPRLNNTDEKFLELFNEVIRLPVCDRNKNPIKLFYQTREFCRQLENAINKKDAYFFMFDVYEWVELLFYKVISNYRAKYSAKLLIISAFNGGEFSRGNVSMMLFKTIYKSIHSFLFTRLIYYEFRTIDSNFDGLNFVKTEADYQLNIQNSYSTSMSNATFEKLFYPPLIFSLDYKFKNKLEIGDNSVVLLLESNHLGGTINYWEITNVIISMLQEQGFKVLLKNHPSVPNSPLNKIKSKDVIYLNNRLSFEEIIISNSSNIRAVIGYGSTALITSSWMGICSIDISNLYSLSQSLLNRFNDFINLGSKIQKILLIEEIKLLSSYIGSINELPNLYQLRHQWEYISSEIFKNEN